MAAREFNGKFIGFTSGSSVVICLFRLLPVTCLMTTYFYYRGGSNEASGSSNWWGGWLQAAVNKVVAVLPVFGCVFFFL